MSLGIGERIEVGGITSTQEILRECKIEHAHIYVPTGKLRYSEKQDGKMMLEQEFGCTVCGDRFWQVVPIVKETINAEN